MTGYNFTKPTISLPLSWITNPWMATLTLCNQEYSSDKCQHHNISRPEDDVGSSGESDGQATSSLAPTSKLPLAHHGSRLTRPPKQPKPGADHNLPPAPPIGMRCKHYTTPNPLSVTVQKARSSVAECSTTTANHGVPWCDVSRVSFRISLFSLLPLPQLNSKVALVP